MTRSAPFREQVARALKSGAYIQQEPQSDPSVQPLRDQHDRYTVTGVAVAEDPQQIWVKDMDRWGAVWFDVLTAVLPLRRIVNGDIADLSPKEEDTLKYHGAIAHVLCPETTADLLGLPHETSLITFAAAALPSEQLTSLGIPANTGQLQLIDSLDFETAAVILTTQAQALGICDCQV